MNPAARLSALALFAAVLSFSLGDVRAETYPTKPIRFIVPFQAGGSVDLMARLIGQKLTEGLGQPVVMDNRAGAAGNIGTELAAKSLPDGYTLVFVPASHAINISLYKKLPYDPVKDFAPVSLVASTSQILLVNPSFPPRTVKELITLAKSNPRQLNYGSAGSGSVTHLTMELFRSMTGIDIVHIPYRGSPQSMADLMAGQVAILFTSLPGGLPHVKAGKLRGLAVTSSKRSPSAPDLPTISETVPGYEVVQWYGVLAPAGTPDKIIARLDAEIGRTLAISDFKERLAVLGAEPTSSTPRQFAEYIDVEIRKWAKVVKDSGARID